MNFAKLGRDIVANMSSNNPLEQIWRRENCSSFPPIVDNSTESTFLFLNTLAINGYTAVDPAEIVVPGLVVNVVNAHAQLNNKLLIANVQDKVTDWSSFQKLANNIETEYFTYIGDSYIDCENDYIIGYDATNTKKLLDTPYGNTFLNVTLNRSTNIAIQLNTTFDPDTTGGLFDGFFNFVSTPLVGPNPYNLNSNFYTVPTNGYYQVEIIIKVNVNNQSNVNLRQWGISYSCWRNGAIFLNNSGYSIPPGYNGNKTLTSISDIYFLNAGDTIELNFTPNFNFDINADITFSIKGSLTYSDNDLQNYKDYSFPTTSFDNKTYMRDEIYALGIVFLFDDGSESPVFHIPGRPKIGTPPSLPHGNVDTSIVTDLIIDGYTYNTQLGINYWSNLDNGVGDQPNGDIYNVWDPSWGPSTLDNWDTYSLSLGTTSQDYLHYRDLNGGNRDAVFDYVANCEVLLSYSNCNDSTIERWKHINTSISKIPEEGDPLYDPNDFCKHKYLVNEIGIMGYYDTGTLYPDTKDCNGIPIYPHDVVYNSMGDVIRYDMHKIRHHHMPDARKVHIQDSIFAAEGGGFSAIGKCIDKTVLLPLGIKYSNIDLSLIPLEIRTTIKGYYFVRGDRAGNKTVIDKGWMNVTDATYGHQHSSSNISTVDDDYKKIEINKWFLTPDWKIGMISPWWSSGNEDKFVKRPDILGWNIVEFFSPKSSMNEAVDLGGDYYKLENTIYGGFSITSGLDGILYVSPTGLGACGTTGPDETTNERYRLTTYGVFNKFTLPNMYELGNRANARGAYVLPIQKSEYSLYNQTTTSSLASNYQLVNDGHRQRIMISKLFYNDPGDAYCKCNKPRQTSTWFGSGLIRTGVEDIIPWTTPGFIFPNTSGNGHAFTNLNEMNHWNWIDVGTDDDYGYIGRQFYGPNCYTNSNGETIFCRTQYSPFAYYAALKADITPYTSLQDIRYIKTTNYVIESPYDFDDACFGNKSRFYVTGGDCFITRQQLIKSYYMKGEDGDNNNQKHRFAGSLIWGYVESEINAHYRNKKQGDQYYAYPWDSIHESVYEATLELREDNPLSTTVEQFYHYRLDYSKDNTSRYYFPLPNVYRYCTDCSNRYPYTIFYSDTSFPEEQKDAYRIFKVGNNRTIPGDTGEITNLVVKEQQLFTFTLNNLWRFNVSPQQLKTDIDVVQIGQGEFLGTLPVKIFDNKQGSPRGGCEFKFSGAYGDDSYIWVDNLSGRVYELTQGIKEISLAGMKRFFKNNLLLKFKEQFNSVTINAILGYTTGREYDIFSTAAGMGVGYIGNYDPQYNRYIIHKRDFTITEAGLDNDGLLRIKGFAPQPNTLYIDPITNVFYNGNTIITSFEEYPEFFKNESFTLSYSIQDKVWVSFHSYLPSFMYYDFDTFYTNYGNNVKLSNISWKHNVHNYTSYCEEKFNFILDYIQAGKNPYQENVFDTVEFTSNTFEWDPVAENYKEIQFTTFTQMYVYNNNQISNLKDLIVSNLNPYQHIQFNTNTAYVNKDRNYWRIKKFRDMSVNRLTSPESLFSKDWTNVDYTNYFTTPGLGFIDKIINPNIIDLNKNGYKQQRFTDKYLGVRLFFDPKDENGNPLNYKINFNISSDLTRNKI